MSRNRQRPPIVAILFLIAFLVGVLYFVAGRQLTHSKTHRLRLLSGFSGRVEATVPDLAERFLRIAKGTEKMGAVQKYVDQIPYLTYLEEHSGLTYLEEHSGQSTTQLAERPQLTLDSGGSDLYLVYRGPGPEGSDGPLRTVRARLDLKDLLMPAALPGAFESILVATGGNAEQGEAGKILFQQGEPELRLTSLKVLFDAVSSSGDDGASDAPTRGIMRFLRGEKREIGRKGLLEHPSTASIPMRIAEEEYLFFFQPILVDLPLLNADDPSPPISWLAGGIVSRDRLLSASFTTSPTLLFVLMSIFPLAVICWPFLKLWLVSPRQRITRLDVVFLLVSAALGCFLSTLLVLDLHFLGQTREQVDHQLDTLAQKIDKSFYRELGQAHAQLESLDSQAAKEAIRKLDLGDKAVTDSATTDVEAALLGPDELQEISESEYPIFHSVFWVDPTGGQVLKLALREHSIRKAAVEDREYFRCARGERPPFVLELPDPDDPQDGPGESVELCVESVISNTGGADQTILAIPQTQVVGSDASEPCPGCPPIMATRLASLSHSVLAPSFGFAIVDVSPGNQGQVLFHSDPRRILSENLLKASDEDSLLASLFEARREGTLSLQYWGQRHRAHVQPLPGLPWALVTFRGTEDLRLRNIELIYDLVNPVLLVVSIVPLAWMLFFFVFRDDFRASFWPDSRKKGVYRAIVLGSVLGLGIFSLLVALESRYFPFFAPTLFWASLLLPFGGLGVAALALIVKHRHDRSPGDGEGGWETTCWKALQRLGAVGTRRSPGRPKWLGLQFQSVAEGIVMGLGVLLSLAALVVFRSVTLWFLLAAVGACVVAWFGLEKNFHGYQQRWSYVFAMSCLLFVVAAVPALGFFTLAAERQTTFLVQDVQQGLVRSRELQKTETLERPDRAGRLFQAYKPHLTQVWEEQIATFHETEISEASSTSPPPGSWPWAGSVAKLFAARPIPVNDLSSDPTGVDLSRFEATRGTWNVVEGEGSGPRRIRGRLGEDLGTGNEQVVRSKWPQWNVMVDMSKARTWAFLLLCIMALAAPVLLVSSIAHRVLFISLAKFRSFDRNQDDLDHPRLARLLEPTDQEASAESRDLVNLAELLEPENLRRGRQTLLVIGVPELAIQILNEDDHHLVSWEEFDRDALEEIRRAEKDDNEEPKSVVLVGFRPEPQGGVPEQEKIRVAEDLVRDQNRPVVLLSEVDPQQVLMESGGFGVTEPNSRKARIRRQWATWLGIFTYRYAVERGDATEREPFMARLRWLQIEAKWAQSRQEQDLEKTEEKVRELQELEEHGREMLQRLEPSVEPAVEAQFQREAEDWTDQVSDRLRDARDELRESVAQRRDGRYEETSRVLGIVERECSISGQLLRIGRQVLHEISPEDYEAFTEQKMVSKIALLARSYYQAIWTATTEEEKVVLTQLAYTGLVSPKNHSRILDLMHRGLIVRDPELRPMNKSFAQFVRHTVPPTQMLEWEAEEGTSLWSILRWLLPVPLLLLGGFLFVTQRDVVSSAVGLVLAAGAVAPTLINLFSYFEQRFARKMGRDEGQTTQRVAPSATVDG